MTTRIHRSINKPIREGLTWDERWRGKDKGLITCWEVGRKMREERPELAERAAQGELPPMGWKGGIERDPKYKKKVGVHFYLAQWQGLRGEDLDIDLSEEPSLTCSRTGVVVTFTSDFDKYSKA